MYAVFACFVLVSAKCGKEWPFRHETGTETERIARLTRSIRNMTANMKHPGYYSFGPVQLIGHNCELLVGAEA